MLRHLPNLLSALRLLAAPFAAWLILQSHDTAALLVFAAAGASDGLDGFIARRWGFTSQFGAWLDPAADKLLALLCFTALWKVGIVPVWLLLLVLARDGAIAAGWLLAKALSLPVAFDPPLIGKAATVVQVVYVLGLLLMLAFDIQAPQLALAGAVVVAALIAATGLLYALIFLRGVSAGRRIA
jgi:cardiolipin synthase